MKKVPKYDRICLNCQEVFVSKQSRTNYCCKPCNTAHYKRTKKEELMGINNANVQSKSNETDFAVFTHKKYLNMKEACLYLGISRSTLYRRIQNGDIEIVDLQYNSGH